MSYLLNSLKNISIIILAVVQFPFIYPKLYKQVVEATKVASQIALGGGEKELETSETALQTPSFLRQSHFDQRRRVIGKSITTNTSQDTNANSVSKET